jgi:hypothetical protein
MTVPAGDGPLKGNAAMNTNTLPETGRHDGATHSFAEKRTRPAVSLRLLTVVAVLLLAVAAVALRHHLPDCQPALQQFVNTVADLWEYNRS